jgi:hypothetical protein
MSWRLDGNLGERVLGLSAQTSAIGAWLGVSIPSAMSAVAAVAVAEFPVAVVNPVSHNADPLPSALLSTQVDRRTQ